MIIRAKKKDLERIYIENRQSLSRLNNLISDISFRYGLDYNSVLQILQDRSNYLTIPAGIFNNNLSPLENVVLYLTIKFRQSLTQISSILNRDHTTIWTTLAKAEKKISLPNYKKLLSSFEHNKTILIPVHILANRKLSILESNICSAITK
jgi:hypothetical protein